MIRPLTCVCMLLAGGSGLYLYQAKHQAQMLDREIARALKATDAARERIGVLRGEWALLNEPERLSVLSQTHLGLKTLAPGQFATLADLGARLPPVPAPTPPEEPAGLPAIAAPSPAAAPAPTASASTANIPEPPAPARPSVANAKIPSMPSSPALSPGPAPANTAPAGPVQVAALRPPAPPRPLSRPAEPSRLADQRDDIVLARPGQAISAVLGPATPLPAPRPVLAPVVKVAASAVAATARPPAPAAVSAPAPTNMSMGEAMSRAVRPRSAPGDASVAPAPQASASQAPAIQPAASSLLSSPPLATPAPSIPAPFSRPSYSQQASNQISASVLGGVRPALAAPVPFGSATATPAYNAR